MQLTTAQKLELAHQLSRPNGPYAKSQVARALGIGRTTLYWSCIRRRKEQQIVFAIKQWHEQDNTLGHRRLALRLGISENRVRRIMRKYGIKAQRNGKKERAA